MWAVSAGHKEAMRMLEDSTQTLWTAPRIMTLELCDKKTNLEARR